MFANAFPKLISLWENDKLGIVYYVLIAAIIGAVFGLPNVVCYNVGAESLCHYGLQNYVSRGFIAIPILIGLAILRNIRTRKLFFELISLLLIFVGVGFYLGTSRIITQQDIQFFDNIFLISEIFALWLFSIFLLLLLQKRFITLKSRIIFFVPISFATFLIGIFIGITLADTLNPKPMITTAPPTDWGTDMAHPGP